MEKKWFWLSLARRADDETLHFAGALIGQFAAADTAGAVQEAHELGTVPAGVVCKGGPLLDSVNPPAEYTNRILDAQEAEHAKALIEQQAQAGGSAAN